MLNFGKNDTNNFRRNYSNIERKGGVYYRYANHENLKTVQKVSYRVVIRPTVKISK